MAHKTQINIQGGFTLIEIMITMAILAVGILGIMSMQITSIQGNADTVKFTEANLAAQSQLELFVLSDYDSISNDGASTGDGYTVVTSTALNTIPPGYTIEYRVINENTALDTKEIKLRVKDPDGKTRTDLTLVKSGS